jgi:hypothetical protein
MFARISGLLRRVFSPRTGHPGARVRRPLSLEVLEQRLAPARVLGDAYTAPGAGLGSNSGDYVLSGMSWPQPGGPGSPITITYSYSNLLDGGLDGGLSAATIQEAIQQALGLWASVAPLRFVEEPDAGPPPSNTDYNPDGVPMIRFGHMAIDGPGNTLGYGYYPGQTGLGGDIHLDEAEDWSVNPNSGLDLLEVATHEIGHALGLAHEPPTSQGGQDAIMNPYYGGRFHGLGTGFLYPSDIHAVEAIYGTGTGSVTPLWNVPTFAVQGSTLTVSGTPHADTITVTAGASSSVVTVNGSSFTVDFRQIHSIVINGYDGGDTLSLTLGPGADSIYLGHGAGVLLATGYRIDWSGAQTVNAYGGSNDTAHLFDSGGDDTFGAYWNHARMYGPGFDNHVYNFGAVNAYSRYGGSDVAYLVDSPGNDTFTATPGWSRMQGPGFSVFVQDFAQVHATSRNGGTDFAGFYASAGNATFGAMPSLARMYGPGFDNWAQGFATVNAFSTAGGTDRAVLVGSPGNDVLTATPTSSRLQGSGFNNYAQGFATVYASAGGGSDVANFYDSAGNDTFGAMPSLARMYGPGFDNWAQGFATVNAFSTAGGHDTAVLVGSSGSNTFTGSGTSGSLTRTGASVTITGFDLVRLYAGPGGPNRLSRSGLSYNLETTGTWS